MADLSRDDVTRAVRDGLNDFRNDLNRIKDSVQRVEDRTNDLDRSQEEIKRLADLIPRLETLTRDNKIERIAADVEQLKSTQASSTQYLQQISKYLESIDRYIRQEHADEVADKLSK